MAEYTITIKDVDDLGIVVNLSGPTNPEGPAARLALSLVTLAPKLIGGGDCRAARDVERPESYP